MLINFKLSIGEAKVSDLVGIRRVIKHKILKGFLDALKPKSVSQNYPDDDCCR